MENKQEVAASFWEGMTRHMTAAAEYRDGIMAAYLEYTETVNKAYAKLDQKIAAHNRAYSHIFALKEEESVSCA